jgi:hypothetical protein
MKMIFGKRPSKEYIKFGRFAKKVDEQLGLAEKALAEGRMEDAESHKFGAWLVKAPLLVYCDILVSNGREQHSAIYDGYAQYFDDRYFAIEDAIKTRRRGAA